MNIKKLISQRAYRKTTNGRNVSKKYEKTKSGFLMRTYRNMQSRITGIQKAKAHLYLGKELLNRIDFYEFSLNDIVFNKLFLEWENSNYDRRLTPSIDRLKTHLGYTLNNIRWLTHSENSRFGGIECQKLKKLQYG